MNIQPIPYATVEASPPLLVIGIAIVLWAAWIITRKRAP